MPDYLQTGLSTVKDLFTYFNDRSRSSDRLKNNILRELRDNLKLLEHRNKEGVQMISLLESLSAAAIHEAYTGNYQFSKLCEGQKTLHKKLVFNKQQEKYIGWSAEKMIYNIEGKIRDLRNLPKLYPDLDNAPINLTVRLDNLYHLLLLFGVFISRKS